MRWLTGFWGRQQPPEDTHQHEYDRTLRLMEERLSELGASVEALQAGHQPERPGSADRGAQ